jgi:hypothetical protein
LSFPSLPNGLVHLQQRQPKVLFRVESDSDVVQGSAWSCTPGTKAKLKLAGDAQNSFVL